MLRGLITDHISHLRDCMLISGSLLVSLSAGLAYLHLAGKKTDRRIGALIIYCAFALIILVCPLTASVLRILTGTYYDSQDMWNMIPLVPLGAVMCTALFGELYSRDRKIPVLPLIFFTSAILLCGSLGGMREERSGRPENAAASEREAVEIAVGGSLITEGAVVLASDDMTAYIRTACPGVRTLYGRDMWDGRLTKNRYGYYDQSLCDIHDDMIRIYLGEHGLDPSLAPDTAIRAFESGADHILFPGYVSEDGLREAGCTAVSLVTSDGSTYILASRKAGNSGGDE